MGKDKAMKKTRRKNTLRCSKKLFIMQRCPGLNESSACNTYWLKKNSTCMIELVSGFPDTFRFTSEGSFTFDFQSIRRTKNLRVDFLPVGFKTLEFYMVNSLEMHDIVVPEGTESIHFKLTNLHPYPSAKFRNITLPKSMSSLHFEYLSMDSFDPSDWRDVPLKTMVLYKTSVKSVDHAVFPPSITSFQIRYGNLTTLETSTLPTSVIAMNLEYNQLSTVESIPMTSLHNLTYLNLDGNPFYSLGENSSFPASVHNLSMADCQLENISDKFAFPPNLLSLDLSNNRLESFPLDKLPKSLKRLQIESNPLREFNIDDLDMLDFLKNIPSFDATTDIVQCNQSYTKTIVRGKIYACISQGIHVNNGEAQVQSTPKTKMSATTTVFIVIFACIAAVALTAIFVLRVRQRRQKRLANQADLESIDECDNSSTASFELTEPPKEKALASFRNNDAEKIKPSSSLVSLSTWRDPSFISSDSTLVAYLLEDDAVRGVIPMMGNLSSGMYMDQRVCL
ncbi:hypothetical protein AeRB84_016675 [Aphanomyces euteiches]|nr:hypothetical protein AeRB84_016675 [Aphanomyces euteiches]